MLSGLLPVRLTEAQIHGQSDKWLTDAVGCTGCWLKLLQRFCVGVGFRMSAWSNKRLHIEIMVGVY